ncbi:MAG: glucose-1-phosphate cytidylyltransferase [Fimbriiglobus sp.]|jgi:glucose-1-phosphate cytidylyltransferase|nr:glucose-1-phosphate cytidylyltransferase [Fimbriiglobus sp.]
MKTVLLAGGLGTRLAEETTVRPKPMVEVGGVPLLVHIMRTYAAHGFRDFLVACGYKGEMIKEYFTHFSVKHSDWHINLKSGDRTRLGGTAPDWDVWAVDTGASTMTGGRVRRLRSLLGDRPFLCTYGDGVSDVDIARLVAFHRGHGKLATVTAVRPPARFGSLELDGDRVGAFAEKPQVGEGWINGGYFVFEPGVFDYLTDDATVLEREPLERLARDGQLMAYKHTGFWHPMDTLRDKELLERLWAAGNAPWQVPTAETGATS